MFRRSIDLVRLCLLAAAASSMTCGGAGSLLESGGRYEDLAALFQAWRAFQRPVHADGVPDYTEAAMAAQHRGLTNIRRRLDAIDTRDWPREPSGRLAPRSGGDERARFRSSGAPAVGQQSSVLRHVLPLAERSARA